MLVEVHAVLRFGVAALLALIIEAELEVEQRAIASFLLAEHIAERIETQKPDQRVQLADLGMEMVDALLCCTCYQDLVIKTWKHISVALVIKTWKHGNYPGQSVEKLRTCSELTKHFLGRLGAFCVFFGTRFPIMS